MPFTIPVDNSIISIHVDTKGNLYFEYLNNLFQLNIDKNNEPYLESGNYEIIENDNNIIKGKIFESSDFQDDNYFLEDNGHAIVYSYEFEDDQHNDNEENPFIFCDNGLNLEIKERNFGDINALYDIFIYDDTDEDEHSKLIFQTKLLNEICIYRVALYKSGKIFFRPIGCFVEKTYDLHIHNNEICIQQFN
jgi:hypothetical protein